MGNYLLEIIPVSGYGYRYTLSLFLGTQRRNWIKPTASAGLRYVNVMPCCHAPWNNTTMRFLPPAFELFVVDNGLPPRKRGLFSTPT